MAEKPTYVTTVQLAAELRAMRWETRALILLNTLAVLGVGYKLNIPGVEETVGLALSALPF